MRVNSYLLRKMMIEEIEREQTGISLNENKRYRRLFLTEEDLERAGASIEAPENEEEALRKIATPSAIESLKNNAKSIALNAAEGFKKKIIAGGIVTLFFAAFKHIPALGSLAALGDFFVETILMIQHLKDFTKNLLEVSKVELSGVRSILGKYSILDASPEDLRKVAAGLKENMNEEQRVKLDDQYKEVMESFKDVVINLLLAVKEFTFEWSQIPALALEVLPVELGFKEFMMWTAKAYAKQSKEIKFFIQCALTFSTYGSFILPIFGFFSDIERVAAFSEIDDVITKNNNLKKDVALYVAKKGAGKLYKNFAKNNMAAAGLKTSSASDIFSGALRESKTNCRINLLENELKTLNRSFVLVKARR